MNQQNEEQQQFIENSSEVSNTKITNAEERSEISHAAFNYLKGLIGVGILTMPYAAMHVGFLHAGILILVCGYASIKSVRMLVYIADDMDHNHALYGHLVSEVLGHKYTKLFDGCFFIAIVCQCVTYIIFFEILIQHSINGFFSLAIYGISLLITLPFSLVVNIHKMSLLSLIGVIFCILTILSVLLYQYVDLMIGDQPFRFSSYIKFDQTYRFVGFVLFAFQNVFLALPIRRSMKHPRDFKYVAFYAYGSTTILVIIFVIGTLLTVGIETEQIAIFNIKNKLFSSITSVMFACSIMVAFAVNIYPAFQIVDFYLHSVNYHDIPKNEQVKEKELTLHSILIRVSIVVLIHWCAYIIPNIIAFVNLQGNILAITIQFIVPSILYSIWFKSRMSYIRIAQVLFVLTLAFIALFIGLYDTYNAIFEQIY